MLFNRVLNVVRERTFVGAASKVLLSGPTTLTPVWGSAPVAPLISAPPSTPTPKFQMPYPSKPQPSKLTNALPATVTVPPVVSCPGPSCDTVSTSADGATTQPMGLNAYDSGTSYGPIPLGDNCCTASFDSTGTFTLTGQGYVTAMHEDLEMPAIGAGASDGNAVMTFTLSGPDYFPSTAFGEFTSTSNGLLSATIHIADLGMAPQDGFTEYQGYPPAATRPRWGDFNWAMYDPVTGYVYFGSGFIQSQACSNFISNPTCGGTRREFANWGTSVNSITP